MASIEEKLEYLAETKEGLRTEIEKKGIGIDERTKFRDYSAKLDEIKSSKDALRYEKQLGDIYDALNDRGLIFDRGDPDSVPDLIKTMRKMDIKMTISQKVPTVAAVEKKTLKVSNITDLVTAKAYVPNGYAVNDSIATLSNTVVNRRTIDVEVNMTAAVSAAMR